MRKLLVATHNLGKVREYREILADLPLLVTYLNEAGVILDVEETGSTFEENAILKATTYAAETGQWTWADDSGLAVDALQGAPGVFSSRFAGPGASDEDRYRKLLHEIAGVPWLNRTARFHCVVALATPDGMVQTVAAALQGYVAYTPVGEFGFGYDPVFYVQQQGCMLAELPPEVKNRISHRAVAAQRARKVLRTMLADARAE
jgi:XTP/dITP diphosphohydrolase